MSSIMHSQPCLIFSYIIQCDKMCNFFFLQVLCNVLQKKLLQEFALKATSKHHFRPAKNCYQSLLSSHLWTSEGASLFYPFFYPFDIGQKIRIFNCFKVNQVNYYLKHLMTLEEKGSKCKQYCGNRFFLLFTKTRDTKPIFKLIYLVDRHFCDLVHFSTTVFCRCFVTIHIFILRTGTRTSYKDKVEFNCKNV